MIASLVEFTPPHVCGRPIGICSRSCDSASCCVYSGHDDDIVSLAVDPTGNFVATGQLGARPRVHIWDSESGARLCVLPLVHRRAILAIAFSPDGKRLLSVGDDDNHTVALYSSASGNWIDGRLDCKCAGDTDKVFGTATCFFRGNSDVALHAHSV